MTLECRDLDLTERIKLGSLKYGSSVDKIDDLDISSCYWFLSSLEGNFYCFSYRSSWVYIFSNSRDLFFLELSSKELFKDVGHNWLDSC